LLSSNEVYIIVKEVLRFIHSKVGKASYFGLYVSRPTFTHIHLLIVLDNPTLSIELLDHNENQFKSLNDSFYTFLARQKRYSRKHKSEMILKQDIRRVKKSFKQRINVDKCDESFYTLESITDILEDVSDQKDEYFKFLDPKYRSSTNIASIIYLLDDKHMNIDFKGQANPNTLFDKNLKRYFNYGQEESTN
jgi:hypothetical protein